jgi:hypothetical protein
VGVQPGWILLQFSVPRGAEGEVVPKPKRKAEANPPAARESVLQVLPMSLRPGDRLADSTGEWEVVGRPHITAGGKNSQFASNGWTSPA